MPAIPLHDTSILVTGKRSATRYVDRHKSHRLTAKQQIPLFVGVFFACFAVALIVVLIAMRSRKMKEKKEKEDCDTLEANITDTAPG